MTALAGVELESLVSEPDVLTTRALEFVKKFLLSSSCAMFGICIYVFQIC